MQLRELYVNRRVVICVGTGGVGKTTVAASLALAAAAEGRQVLVMTIDPSLRLAQALGIDLRAGAHVAETSKVGERGGSLTAQVLDVQATFDRIIHTRAASPAQAQAILHNRIYKHFSASMAGSHEYAAVEALWDAYNAEAYDLVVLDTPPSQHAVDFLEAPDRIVQFLGGGGLVERLPGGAAAKGLTRRLFDLGGTLVTRTVGKISGAETLQDVLAFLHALSDMYDSFKARAEGVGKLLRGDDVAFLLVGAPTPAQLAALAHFVGELKAHAIAPAGFVLNRMRPDFRQAQATRREHGSPVDDDGDIDSSLDGSEGDDANYSDAHLKDVLRAGRVHGLAAEALVELGTVLEDEANRIARDQHYLGQLVDGIAPAPVWPLTEVAEHVDDRQGLTRFAETLLQARSA